MRKLLGLATVLVAVAVFPAAALAVSPHLKGGVKNNPEFTDLGLTLQAKVSYAGLGNFDTLQTLDATANPTATCTNPAGATQPPGQNPASVNVTGSTAVPAAEIDNGNVTITTRTDPPVTPVVGAPDCPNPQWTEDITDMAFTSATIKVFQNTDTTNDTPVITYDTLVLTVTCTFSPPTSDGLVPASGRTCTTS